VKRRRRASHREVPVERRDETVRAGRTERTEKAT
jgi:hypothetical protein